MTNSRELLICALLFLLKNIWRPGALLTPLSVPLTFVGRLRTSCVVPSPLCGESGPFVNFIDKTRIFIKWQIQGNSLSVLYFSSKEKLNISWRPGALSTPLSTFNDMMIPWVQAWRLLHPGAAGQQSGWSRMTWRILLLTFYRLICLLAFYRIVFDRLICLNSFGPWYLFSVLFCIPPARRILLTSCFLICPQSYHFFNVLCF